MEQLTHLPIAERKVLFRTLQLKYHPDKNPGNEEATAVFQYLQREKSWFLASGALY